MVRVTHVCELTKNDWIVHFKLVNCVICESSGSKALQKEKNKERKEDISMQVDNHGKKKNTANKRNHFLPESTTLWCLLPLGKQTNSLFQEAI